TGHYFQWVEACIAGYGKMEVSSPFDIAGPMTESILMGNLAIRSYDIQKKRPGGRDDQFDYPGRFIKLMWDGPNMKITNFDDANQFVRRDYRDGWKMQGL
ncbi:MAG: gfo/Idh/MocA family oxidoreductase, partial [Imperialibacter sp.]